MENIPIIVHFFRPTPKGRIDYRELLEYFQALPNFDIYTDQNEVDIVYNDNDFGFEYEFKITKVSQVKAIYKLDPAYLNINFMLCLPILIPIFAAKEIINFTQKVAKNFDLSIYHESFDDVRGFNVADLYGLFVSSQQAYLEEYGPGEKIFYDSNNLSEICKYQRTLDNLYECMHGDEQVNPCTPVIDRNNDEFGLRTDWDFGIATVFAPHFDFVLIKDENGEKFMIRRIDFLRIMDKYLSKTDAYLPDLYYIKPKQAKAAKGALGKLRKFMIVDRNFDELRIVDLLDKK